MKRTNISLGVFALLLFGATPLTTEAYFTTAQSAANLTNQAGLFTIEYAFGLEDHDLYMPVLAERGLLWESDEKKVGYTLREDEEVIQSGIASGIVLSSAPIVDGMYKLSKGFVHKLTLLVLVTTPSDAPEMDYSLQVERLPFYVDADGEKWETQQLNPTELQYYVTKEIELNSPNE